MPSTSKSIYSYSVNWTQTRLFCNQPEQKPQDRHAYISFLLSSLKKKKDFRTQKLSFPFLSLSFPFFSFLFFSGGWKNKKIQFSFQYRKHSVHVRGKRMFLHNFSCLLHTRKLVQTSTLIFCPFIQFLIPALSPISRKVTQRLY